MAVWFARQTANINAANVWNAAANGSGAWLTWPPAEGDVLMCNSFTLTVNADVLLGAAGQMRNDSAHGATAGGQFTAATTRTITGNIYAGSTATRCLQINTGGNVTLNGNAYGGTVTNAFAIQLAAILNMTGNAYGGTATNTAGIYTTSGTLVFTGNGYGGSIGYGLHISGTTTVTITGDMVGGTSSSANGLFNGTTTPITMTGNAVGDAVAAGVSNGVAGATTNITGNAIAGSGSAAFGISNVSSGAVTLSGYAQASTTAAAIINAAQGAFTVGETRSAPNGRGAVAGAFRFASVIAAKHMSYTPDGQISMTVLDVAAIVPAESDVRSTVVYGDGAYTGTLPLGRTRVSMAGRF
jgi:hypothetical protein